MLNLWKLINSYHGTLSFKTRKPWKFENHKHNCTVYSGYNKFFNTIVLIILTIVLAFTYQLIKSEGIKSRIISLDVHYRTYVCIT